MVTLNGKGGTEPAGAGAGSVRPGGLRRAWRALRFRSFTVGLLLVIGVAFVLGSILPDPSQLSEGQVLWLMRNRPALLWLGEFLNIQQVVRSTPFLILMAFLLLNLALSTWERVRQQLRRREDREPAWRTANGQEIRLSLQRDAVAVAQRAQMLLRRRGYATQLDRQAEAVCLFAHKGRLGFWGSIAFHGSLFLVAAGATLTLATKFSGNLLLTEGQTLLAGEETFQRLGPLPRFGGSFPALQIRLDRFVAEHRADRFPVRFVARLILQEPMGTVREAEVEVNRPLSYRGYDIFLERYGFAPNFAITDRSGRVLLDAYVNLMLMQEEQEDSFAVPGTDLQVRAKLYPDFRLHLGFPTTRSPIPRNPVLDLTVTERGDRVFSGLLPLHQQATFAEHELTFQDLKYWAYFGVTRDWGVPVIAAGLLMASVGLFLRFFCYEKRIRIRATEQEGGSEIRLAGHSRFFPTMLQDELRRLGEALSHER